MSELFQAVNNMTVTTNGMPALKSTLNPLVDLFAQIGTNRGSNMDKMFADALVADQDKTLRILQWVRDVRGGAGERDRFRSLLKFLATTKFVTEDTMYSLISKVPEIGRFDDLHVLVGTQYEEFALRVHVDAIIAGDGLAAKWAPRKGIVAGKMRSIWGVSPKFYRKDIVGKTKVVEQQMCAGAWDEINFSHVPSQAARIYSKAFGRHDKERYGDYITAVISGDEKMNAGAIFPHDLYKAARGYGGSRQADAQWKNLPNYLEGVDERILPVCDVSGSMSGEPMAISVALGLYFSERLEGVFKDKVVTFSSDPKFVSLDSTLGLSERISQLEQIHWGMSTNFEAVFNLLLSAAVKHKVPEDQMPTKILIMSDMQFNACVSGGDDTAVEMIRRKYEEAGYTMPNLIFWNIESKNMPVKFDQAGVGLVSGCSPSVVKAVLGGDIDPVRVMLNAIMVDRYKL